MGYRALSMEYRALLIGYKALFIECKIWDVYRYGMYIDMGCT